MSGSRKLRASVMSSGNFGDDVGDSVGEEAAWLLG
jgi:hypothetical protein